MIAGTSAARCRLARIRQLVNTGLDGTSLRSLCSAAEELGLAARSVKASLHNLDRMPLPAICHWDGDHWLVLYHVTRRHALVADPALGIPAHSARRVRAPVDRLRRALRLHARVRARARRRARPRLALADRPSASCAHAQGARARGRGQRPADGAARLHAGHRGPRAGRTGCVAAATADRGHGRHDGLHRRVAAGAALSAEFRRRSCRRRWSRLHHEAAARLADVVLRDAADRRSAASHRGHAAGPRRAGAAWHRGRHGGGSTRRDRGHHVRLQPMADRRVPGDGALLRIR